MRLELESVFPANEWDFKSLPLHQGLKAHSMENTKPDLRLSWFSKLGGINFMTGMDPRSTNFEK